jgi:excisionase family DNA binding protein
VLTERKEPHDDTKEPAMNRKNYETLAEAAERTHVSVRTLRRWIAQGRLNVYRVGPRLLRVDPDDVEAMMKPSLRRGA